MEHPNQRQFADAFANGLYDGQFNESLAYRSASNMQEVLAWAEGYMTGEKSNSEKRNCDAKEIGLDLHERPEEFQRNTFPKRTNKQKRETILKEILHTRLIPELTLARRTLGRDSHLWCEYHKARGHDTENCFALKNEIEKLIRKGMLKKYVKDDADASTSHPPEEACPKL